MEVAIETQSVPGEAPGEIHEALGLSFRSAIALPDLASRPDDGSATDVAIVRAPVGARLAGAMDVPPLMQVTARAFQFDPPAARYRLTDGRLIQIDPSADASERDVRFYLLGTVLGALCHQRGLLPLHATALEIGGGAVAVAGPSGAGKSTLAAQHLRRGGRVLADDLTAVTFEADGAPLAHPGPRRIKLWADSLALAGWTPAEAPRIADVIDKFALAAPAPTGPAPLRRVYLLRPGRAGAPTFSQLRGPEAAAALVSEVFRWQVASAMGHGGRVLAACARIAGGCEIFELAYTHDASAPYRLLDALNRHA